MDKQARSQPKKSRWLRVTTMVGVALTVVLEPKLVKALQSDLEELARAWIAPEPLADPPTDGPRDIWFFRLDPRPI